MALVYGTGDYHQKFIWDNWIGTNTSNITTSGTSTVRGDYVWNNWVGTTNNITLTYTDYADYNIRDALWKEWQIAPATPDYYRTPEEIQAEADAAQARREEQSRRELAARQVRVAAEDRAMELLLTLLTDEETRHYLAHDEIQVRSEHGNLYVIEKRGVHGNIRQTDEHGCMLGRICVAPGMYDEERRTLPYADGWIGQYLMLKHDEDRIINKGNWSQRATCRMPEVPILRAAA